MVPCSHSLRAFLTLLLGAAVLLVVPTLVSAGSNEASLKFLKENAEKPDVTVLPSGLQYRVLKKGSGASHPTIDSACSCHYEGTLISGDKFDSSYDRGEPTTFAPNQVIKGWTEAMQCEYQVYVERDIYYLSGDDLPLVGDCVFEQQLIY
mmetsp:Transcript_9085/g.18570  ORF Transcript_9085/g.18570 Transcript_9085/m.18570 type:complete len:150 (-) Transcript_9085:958-1407(-)